MIDSIDKAISMAMRLLKISQQSIHPGEVVAAAQKAQEIIDRFKLNIQDLNMDDSQEFKDEEMDTDAEPLDEFVHNWLITPWSNRLANILCYFNQCKMIQVVRPQTNGKTYPIRTYTIIGYPSDVQIVRYLYGYLKNEVIRLTRENCVKVDDSYKRAFSIGIVDTIFRKIEESKSRMLNNAREEHRNNPLALVRIDKALIRFEERMNAISKYVKDNIKTKKSSTGQCKVKQEDILARLHGRKVGEQIRMTKAVADLK